MQAMSAAAEWRAHWPLVMSATIALSMTTIGVYSMGLMMEPLSREFGWSRAQIASGLTIFSVMAVPLGPVGGALVDRFGARKVGLPGVFLSGAAFSLFALLQGSLCLWWAIWLVYGVVTLGVKSTVWTAAVSSVFNSGRGLALAVVLCGSAFGSSGVPIVTNWLIADHGWRVAYLAIGIGWSLIVLLFLVPFFFDARDMRRRAGPDMAATTPPPALAGLSVGEAWRSRPLQKLAVALVFLGALVVAVIVHYVPILQERGLSRGQAAGVVAIMGLVAIPSKLAVGWLIDRFSVGLIAGVIFSMPAITCLILLLAPPSLPVLVCATIFLACASGGHFQMASYMTSRFGGLRNFGKIYGTMTSVMAFSAGLSPMLAGHVFDSTGSYVPVLIGGVPIALLCGVLVSTVGRFPVWAAATPDPVKPNQNALNPTA